MSRIFAVAKRGKDVLKATDPNDFIFHSDYNGFKIIVEKTKNITLAASTNNQSFTEAHNLPFTPLVRGFAKQSGFSQVFLPNFYNISLWRSNIGMGSSGVNFNYIKSDAANITFNFDNTNGTTKDVAIRYFCLEDISTVIGLPQGNGDNTGKIVVAKPGFDASKESNPKNLKFSSQYGTLKYFDKIQSTVTFTADGVTISGQNIYTHNLGYYPYVEAFTRVYIGSPANDYEPVPFFGSGASVAYNASLLIKQNTIELMGDINGVSSSTWHFDFLLFIYKNNLGL